jgi:hypothetical protein
MRCNLLLKEYEIDKYNLLFLLESFAIFVLLVILIQNLLDHHNEQVTNFHPYVHVQLSSLCNLLDDLNHKSKYYIDKLIFELLLFAFFLSF